MADWSSPTRLLPVLGFLTGARARAGFVPPGRVRGLALRATDQDWRHGTGQVVAGPSLLLAMAVLGRPEALSGLTGGGGGRAGGEVRAHRIGPGPHRHQVPRTAPQPQPAGRVATAGHRGRHDRGVVEPQHQALVDGLSRHGSITSAEVRAAMLEVDRRAFVPAAAAGEAYADAPVVLRVDAEGRAISTVSQPTMVALMLEQLQVRPGDHVLEVGTASGYNAALLAALTGGAGTVVTVELDGELAGRAARRLAGCTNVEVVVGDGRLGHPPGAPYQRIVVTAGASAVAPAWQDQLDDGGRLVVPLPDGASREVCVTYEKVGGALLERARMPCRFVPLRPPP